MKLRDAIFCTIVSWCLVACVDLSPVHYVAKDAGGGSDEDAGDGDVDAATSDASTDNYTQECGACLTTTCGMVVDPCNADPKCSTFMMCMTETKCWNEKIVDFANAPICNSVCAMRAEITSQVDPVLGIFIPVLICAQGPTQCAPVCAPVYLQ